MISQQKIWPSLAVTLVPFPPLNHRLSLNVWLLFGPCRAQAASVTVEFSLSPLSADSCSLIPIQASYLVTQPLCCGVTAKLWPWMSPQGLLDVSGVGSVSVGYATAWSGHSRVWWQNLWMAVFQSPRQRVDAKGSTLPLLLSCREGTSSLGVTQEWGHRPTRPTHHLPLSVLPSCALSICKHLLHWTTNVLTITGTELKISRSMTG